jgi:hypothetical protein
MLKPDVRYYNVLFTFSLLFILCSNIVYDLMIEKAYDTFRCIQEQIEKVL